MRTLKITLSLCFAALLARAQDGSNLFDESYVHEIRVTSDNPFLFDSLEAAFMINIDGERKYLPVNVMIDGTSIENVGLSIKGFSSSWAGTKKPFRIDFNEFVAGQHYDGMKKLSLNNAYQDPTFMRDVLALNLMRQAGVRASRTAYARLYLNDQFWGLYILVEQIDKTFIKNNFSYDEGNLFKCMWNTNLAYTGDDASLYKGTMELKTNETEDDWSGFVKFIKYINKVDMDDEMYREVLPKTFSLNDYLKVLAIDVLTQNWDSYYENGRNFYIYEDTEANKFTWIPWDYNFSFAEMPVDIMANSAREFKPLTRNILAEERFVNQFISTYRTILDDNFTMERLSKLINDNKELIYEHVADDPYKGISMEIFESSLEANTNVFYKDTIVDTYEVEDVYFYNWQTGIPDSVWGLGLIPVDTTWYNEVEFDTIQVQGEDVVMMYCTMYVEYWYTVVGLKSFIQQRINTVNSELHNYATVGTDDPMAQTDFDIFPNPAPDYVNIRALATFRDYGIWVYDAQGKVVYRGINDSRINVSSLSPGLYVLYAKDREGNAYRKPFVKQ